MAAPLAIAGAISVGAWLLDKATKVGTAVVSAGQAVARNVPMLEDEVVVEVVGQPGAQKNELYYLALAAANGVVRRFGNIFQINPIAPPSYAALAIEYDAADHWVRCYLKYAVGMTSISVRPFAAGPPVVGNARNFDNLAVYRGPQCDVVGGNFDFVDTLPLPTGIPTSPRDGAPQLPFEGQMILTSCPRSAAPNPAAMTQNPPPSQPLSATAGPVGDSVNPKPPGDNRSRGAVVAAGASQNPGPHQSCAKTLKLIPLAFAALTDPGSLAKEMFTPPTAGPTGS
jgi:hypothetical protein